MLSRLTLLPVFLLAVLAVPRPAAAQETTAQPLLAPPPPPPPEAPSEVASVVIPQVLVGTLSTFVGGISLLVIAAVSHSDPVAYATVAASPSIGGLVVCKVGQTSAYYEGSCLSPLIGAYTGAVTLGLGMWYWYPGAPPRRYYVDTSSDNGTLRIVEAALGVIVGTVVGATVAWHMAKRPRGATSTVTLGPPPPPPAALAAWTDLRPRPATARIGSTLAVPLLSLDF